MDTTLNGAFGRAQATPKAPLGVLEARRQPGLGATPGRLGGLDWPTSAPDADALRRTSAPDAYARANSGAAHFDRSLSLDPPCK